MSIKLIALDLDGTTLNSKNELSDRTRNTLERANASGVNIVISTGRVFSALPSVILSVPGIRYAITSNGAHITDLTTKEIIYRDYIAPEALRRAIEISKEHNIWIEGFMNNEAYIDADFYNDIKKNGCEFRRADYVLKTRQPVENIHKMLLDNETIIENINFFFETLDSLEEMRPVIESIPNGMITSSFKNNLELGGPGTCKKKALVALMEELGVSRDELMCCGDAPNDIEMIKYAGVGVAMGNAWGETKQYADYITLTNDEDGVAHAIEKFVFGE